MSLVNLERIAGQQWFCPRALTVHKVRCILHFCPTHPRLHEGKIW